MEKRIFLGLALLGIGLFCSTTALAQAAYKGMMNNPNANFYDVCAEADAYFETHDKGKGSGWKGYQRWKAENESKFFPSGDRSQSDPHFAVNAYRQFLQNNPGGNGKESFDNGWRDLGPWSVDNITSHYSPGIGRVEAFWVNPTNDQHLYMGSRSGGFWRSLDGGTSWLNSTDTLFAAGVNTIAVSPTNPDSILINVRNGGNRTTHGVYRSADGGLTWNESAFNPTNLGWGGLGTNSQIYKIVYHPTIANLVFVGTNTGLYRSDDNLQTWTQPMTNGSITDIEFHPSDPTTIYMYDNWGGSAFGNNVLRSLDTGMTFIPSVNIPGNSGSEGHIAVSPACDSCVYFASNNGVWTSTDNGIFFTLNSVPDQACDGFAVSGSNPNVMIYGYLDMQGSNDGGNNFFDITSWALGGSQTLPPDYVHADLRTAEWVNGAFYVGTDGYLCKSTDDGATWTQLNNGTGIREFYASGLSQSDWTVQMSGSQDNGTSILDATGWIEWNGGDGMEAIIQPLRPDWMVGSWQFGTRQITRDAGQSRQGANNPEGGSGEADWQAPLLFDPNQQMDAIHFASSIYKSSSFGDDNWGLVGSPGIGLIKVAAIAENNSDIIAIARNSTFRLSTDGGQTFNVTSNQLPNYSITDITFDPNDDSTLIVTYNRYQNDNQKIYLSHDLGANWTNITDNLGNMPIRTVVIDHSKDSYIYVGGEIGVYSRAMEGPATWNLYSPNLPNCTVRDLEIQYGSNVLRASTWGRGLWEYTLENRNEYPSITTTEISEFPMQIVPAPLTDQYVTARISYEQTLSSVFVKWSHGQATLDSTITMSNTVDSTWVSDEHIPHADLGEDVYFKVFSVGAFNDTTETYKFHYLSVQEPPVVVNPPDTMDTIIGIVESNFEKPIRIYPNPSTGNFTIDMGQGYDQVVDVKMHDLSGKLVYARKEQGQQLRVELNEPAGIYLLSLTSGKSRASIKVVLE